MTLKPTGKRIGCVVDAGGNVALRWEGERNVLVGRLSPAAAERLADDLRAAADRARAGDGELLRRVGNGGGEGEAADA